MTSLSGERFSKISQRRTQEDIERHVLTDGVTLSCVRRHRPSDILSKRSHRMPTFQPSLAASVQEVRSLDHDSLNLSRQTALRLFCEALREKNVTLRLRLRHSPQPPPLYTCSPTTGASKLEIDPHSGDTRAALSHIRITEKNFPAKRLQTTRRPMIIDRVRFAGNHNSYPASIPWQTDCYPIPFHSGGLS